MKRLCVPLQIAALAALSGCQQKSHPWEQQGDSAPAPFEPVRAGGGLAARDSGADADAGVTGQPGMMDAGADMAVEEAVSPVRVGGPWVQCYGHFKPSGDPLKDVTRLGLLCGPANGMRRLEPEPFEGAVAAGQLPVTRTLAGKRGECYRIFAVAESSVIDLDIQVLSSRNVGIAADHNEDTWPIVQADRPFGPLADDALTVELSTRRGGGRFAAEVWVLRTGPRAD
jgi:hypothetical protein